MKTSSSSSDWLKSGSQDLDRICSVARHVADDVKHVTAQFSLNAKQLLEAPSSVRKERPLPEVPTAEEPEVQNEYAEPEVRDLGF